MFWRSKPLAKFGPEETSEPILMSYLGMENSMAIRVEMKENSVGGWAAVFGLEDGRTTASG